MKSKWEEQVPSKQALELNIDIVMSASPNLECAKMMLKLLQIEKVSSMR